jgi:predicted TIM-barrel fold metal-dependent hydrolase
MNQATFTVIDSDAHVIENNHTWDFLEPSEAKYRPKKLDDPDVPDAHYWEVNGLRGPPALTVEATEEAIERAEKVGRRIGTPRESRLMEDVGARIRHMDSLGIDVQVLHNTLFLYDMTEEPDGEAALTRSWNRWMGETWKMSDGRLPWSCLVPTRLLDEAKIQMRWAKENGAVAVCMRPLEGERLITDAYFNPLLEEAQRLDMPIAIHIANGNAENVRLYGLRPSTHRAAGFGIFRVPTVAACMYLIMSDISTRFPDLRWGFIEASAQWIPWIHREAARRLQAAGEEVPESLFEANNIYVTCQIDEDLPWILKYAGEKCLLIGTDYGHNDPSADIDAMGLLRAREDIGAATKERILSQNPSALFGLGLAN